MVEDCFGKDCMKGVYVWKMLFDLGIVLFLGFDFFVEFVNFFYGFYVVVM